MTRIAYIVLMCQLETTHSLSRILVSCDLLNSTEEDQWRIELFRHAYKHSHSIYLFNLLHSSALQSPFKAASTTLTPTPTSTSSRGSSQGCRHVGQVGEDVDVSVVECGL